MRQKLFKLKLLRDPGKPLVLLLHGGLDDVARNLLLRDGNHPAVGELGHLLPPQLKHPGVLFRAVVSFREGK